MVYGTAASPVQQPRRASKDESENRTRHISGVKNTKTRS